jgi:hypothetical protein
MELPDDILQTIKEYSMPITRPNWRSLHVMPSERFHMSVAQTINRTFPQSVFEMISQRDTEYKYHMEYYNGVPYIDCIFAPHSTTTSGWPIYVPIHVPF